MSDDLNEILEGTNNSNENIGQSSPQEPAQQDAEPNQPQTEEKVENEEVTTTAEEKQGDTEESWTKTAVLDERRKRQSLEEEIKQLKGQMQQSQETQVEKPKRPDVFDDPDGAFDYMNKMFDEKLNKTRFEMSREIVKSMHDDYQDVVNVFLDKAKNNPLLEQQLNTAPNPALFAYETGKNFIETQKLTDPNYREQLKEELRKEIMAEQPQLEVKKSNDKLPNLTNATSAKSGDKYPSEPSLSELLD